MGIRSLPFYVTALSAHASDMSSWIFMAYPAAVYLFGGIKIWVAVGLWAGMLANWLLVAPRLRTESERLGAVTLGGYFSHRYGDPSGLMRTLGALMSLLSFTVYISSGLVAILTPPALPRPPEWTCTFTKARISLRRSMAASASSRLPTTALTGTGIPKALRISLA